MSLPGKAITAATRWWRPRFCNRPAWEIDLRLTFPEEDCANLTRKKIRRPVGGTSFPSSRDVREARPSVTIVLDGLLGLGTKHLLREPVRTDRAEINRLRREENAFVFAVDLADRP